MRKEAAGQFVFVHVLWNIEAFREKVEEGAINAERVNTKDNLADILTKLLPRDTRELSHPLEPVRGATVRCEHRGSVALRH